MIAGLTDFLVVFGPGFLRGVPAAVIGPRFVPGLGPGFFLGAPVAVVMPRFDPGFGPGFLRDFMVMGCEDVTDFRAAAAFFAAALVVFLPFFPKPSFLGEEAFFAGGLTIISLLQSSLIQPSNGLRIKITN